jgi:electron transfer flavoprotein alpha subunit
LRISLFLTDFQSATDYRMLRSARSSSIRSVLAAQAQRGYATEAGAIKTLLFLEHRDGKINPGSLNALSAATALGGDVVGLVTGEGDAAQKVADAAKRSALLMCFSSRSRFIGRPAAES